MVKEHGDQLPEKGSLNRKKMIAFNNPKCNFAEGLILSILKLPLVLIQFLFASDWYIVPHKP